MTNVQEAAARLRRMLDQIEEEAQVDYLGTGSDRKHANREEAAWRQLFVEAKRVVCELIPADDAELLDEAWLRTTNIQFGRTRLNIGRFGRINVDVVGMIGLTVWVNGESLDWPITRGDVRLLCRALGIPLSESPATRQEPTT